MHIIQKKLLELLENDLKDKTLRGIGEMIDEKGSPQKIKHHLLQLANKCFITIDKRNNIISKTKTSGNIINIPIIGTVGGGEKLSQEALNWIFNK